MVRVPEARVASGRQGRADLFQRIRSTPADFGASTGRALQIAGSTVTQAADQLGQVAERLKQQDDAVAALNAVTAARNDADLYVYGGTKDGELVGGVIDLELDDAIGAAERATKQDFPEIARRASEKLTPAQQAIFSQEWAKDREVYSNKIVSHEAAQRQRRRELVRSSQVADLEQRGNVIAGRVQSDWRSWGEAMREFDTSVERAATVGVDAAELSGIRNGFIVKMSGAAVRGWFSEQSDQYAAADKMARGDMGDPALDKMWGQLSPDQKDAVFADAIGNANKLASMRNQAREAEKEVVVARDKENLRRVFFDINISIDDKWEILAGLKQSDGVSIQAIEKAEDFLRSGARQFGEDFDRDVTLLKMGIWRGEITSIDQALEYVGNGVSWATFESQILPLIESRGEDVQSDILAEYSAKLGVGQSTLFADQNDATRKVADFEARLREWMRKNPEGDPWAQAEQIFSTVQKASSGRGAAAMTALMGQYRKAQEAGDPEALAEILDTLKLVMVNEGYATPQEAVDPAFDPEKAFKRGPRGENDRR